MALQYKILGQVAPSAGSLTTMYTVPNASGNYAVISTITICNQVSTSNTYRINIRKNGDTAAQNKQYIAYDTTIAGNDLVALTLGITMGPGDTLNVYGTAGSIIFNCYGVENS
jgi:hypothetical protein